MANHSTGLSTSEHEQAGGLLRRAAAMLKGVEKLVGRYPQRSDIRREIERAVSGVQAARIHLENQARCEHPDADVVYLRDDPAVNTDALIDALACEGEGIATD